jgi:hypothetical protein
MHQNNEELFIHNKLGVSKLASVYKHGIGLPPQRIGVNPETRG